MAASPLVDLLLPGAGLIVRGRPWLGAACLLPALFAASVLLLSGLIAARDFAGSLRLGAVVAYAALALSACAVHAVLARRPRLDETAVRALHGEAATAWLRGDAAAALAVARRLTAAASALPGAWRLVELIAADAGQPRDAARARTRRERLEREAEDAA